MRFCAVSERSLDSVLPPEGTDVMMLRESYIRCEKDIFFFLQSQDAVFTQSKAKEMHDHNIMIN